MVFVSGRYVSCLAPSCSSLLLTVVREHFDETDRVWVGEQRCDACGARMLYSRRAETPLEKAMAKRPPTESHRVTTHPSNGSPPESTEVAPATITAAEAMRRAVQQLGEQVIDDDLAPSQLRTIAEAAEHLVAEQAAFHQKNEAAKVAKKAVELAEAALLRAVLESTHPKPLPLFDAGAREADLQAMVAGAEAALTEGEA